MNYKQFKVISILVTTYVIIGHVALKHLQQQGQENVIEKFQGTTLLVVAHPDDETMFFGPTILNLIRHNKPIDLLCLTSGNSEGLGEQRHHELLEVVRALSPNISLVIVDDPYLPDNITREWNSLRVSEHIEEQLKKSNKQIGTLITFDDYGISGHLNHISIYRAIKYLVGNKTELKIMTLKSVSIWRKYMSFLDSTTTVIINFLMQYKSTTVGIDLIEYSSLKKVLMIHKSQMLWFRQLYMIFSRYMFINDLEYLT